MYGFTDRLSNLPPGVTDQQIEAQTSDAEDLAPESCACPACGERDMDNLVWIDDETLRCECGREYKP